MEQQSQRQDALSDQLADVEAEATARGVSGWEKVQLANKMGCYDAADLLKSRLQP